MNIEKWTKDLELALECDKETLRIFLNRANWREVADGIRGLLVEKTVNNEITSGLLKRVAKREKPERATIF